MRPPPARARLPDDGAYHAPMSYDLERFVHAQDAQWQDIDAELRAGRKRTHWIWFVFPQLRGLGRSEASEHYGLASLEEARAYLAHPILGQRLMECTRLVLSHPDRTPTRIFGADDVKVRSCMTLFHRAAPGEPAFRAVLEWGYGGEPDGRTDALLGGA